MPPYRPVLGHAHRLRGSAGIACYGAQPANRRRCHRDIEPGNNLKGNVLWVELVLRTGIWAKKHNWI